MRGLWNLVWIEIKIFLREPMGAFGTVIAPVLVLMLFGRIGTAVMPRAQATATAFFKVSVPVFVAILIAINAVVSLLARNSILTDAHIPLFNFTVAVLITTWSILSIGFVIASIVPTARFAQPIS